MSIHEFAVLEANMPRIEAELLLDEYRQGNAQLGPDRLFDTVMEATGNENLANAYRVARIKADWKK